MRTKALGENGEDSEEVDKRRDSESAEEARGWGPTEWPDRVQAAIDKGLQHAAESGASDALRCVCLLYRLQSRTRHFLQHGVSSARRKTRRVAELSPWHSRNGAAKYPKGGKHDGLRSCEHGTAAKSHLKTIKMDLRKGAGRDHRPGFNTVQGFPRLVSISRRRKTHYS